MAVSDCPPTAVAAYCLPAAIAEAGAQLTTNSPAVRLTRRADGRLVPMDAEGFTGSLFLREARGQAVAGGTVFGQRDCKVPETAAQLAQRGVTLARSGSPVPQVTCTYAAAFVPEGALAETLSKGWVETRGAFLSVAQDSRLKLSEIEDAIRYGPGQGAPVSGFAPIPPDPVSSGRCASLIGPFCVPKAYDAIWTYRFGIVTRVVDGQRYAPSQAVIDQVGVRIALINSDSISFTPLDSFPRRAYEGGVLFARRQCVVLTCTYAATYVLDNYVKNQLAGAILTPMEIAAKSPADLARVEAAISIPIETRTARLYVPLSELPLGQDDGSTPSLKEVLPFPGIDLQVCRTQGLEACLGPKAP